MKKNIKTKNPKKTPKPITLSSKDARAGGVVGGVAEHFKKDPAWLRVAAIVAIILTGIIPGVILYGAFWALLKKNNQ